MRLAGFPFGAGYGILDAIFKWERKVPMRLIPLWEADEERAYDLQKSFAPNENGFVNGAYGLSRQAFSKFVQLRKRNSQGLDLPEGHVPDTVYVLEDDSEGYVGIVKLRHRLNDALRQGAGHIGYGIRTVATPQRRCPWLWMRPGRSSQRTKSTFLSARITPPPSKSSCATALGWTMRAARNISPASPSPASREPRPWACEKRGSMLQ